MSDQGAGNIPVTGDEHVLLQNDEGAWIGEATTQQIADLAGAVAAPKPAFPQTEGTAEDPLQGGRAYLWNRGGLDETELVVAWGFATEPFPRFSMESDGSLNWGDGTADPAASGPGYLIPVIGGVKLKCADGSAVEVSNGSVDVHAAAGGAVALSVGGGPVLNVDAAGFSWLVSGNPLFTVGTTIPTSDPHEVGKAWKSGTALQISAG